MAEDRVDVLRHRVVPSPLGDVIIVAGGVIPQQDYQALYDAGVHAIFGPGSNIPEAASQILYHATPFRDLLDRLPAGDDSAGSRPMRYPAG